LASNGFLLDTTILIDFFRGRMKAVQMLGELVKEGPLSCCPVVLAEAFSGVRPEELAKVEEFLTSLVYYPIPYETARLAGQYRRDYQKKGVTLSISDTLIAAVAVMNSLILVTRNVQHFPMPELAVIEHS
jgi:predicted nucleic acid-binding protein